VPLWHIWIVQCGYGRAFGVIESILFFSLGFLCAGFLALMIAPAVWRRAVLLTRKRIEASVPLSLNEIQADKDRMRAEFAMSTRRLEMSIKAFRDKASSQIVEINRHQAQLKELTDEIGEKNAAITAMESQGSELRAELRRREEQLQVLSGRLDEATRRIDEKALELDKLGRLYDDAAFNSSSRQIELVAREAEYERVSDDLNALRGKRRDVERQLREATAENKQNQDLLKAERLKITELEKKIERMESTIADREERLDRREKDLARLREHARSGATSENDLNERLSASESQRVKLEADLADLTLQMSTLLSGATGGDVEKAMGTLNEERDQLQERLTRLVRENKKLKADLAVYERDKSEDWDLQRRENALLREQINDLAAEVVRLTETLDGPESPITVALAADIVEPLKPAGERRPTSLAERVRALKQASAAR
jgi:chromosome segregation ATPase